MSQEELDLKADYGWMHVMRARLAAGLIAEIGPTAWAVYTVIKAHAEHLTGVAYPSQERIGNLIGKTADTVGDCTKVLEAAGLLHKAKRGRHTVYRILEAAPITDRQTGDPHGTADFPYVPAQFANQLQAIKAFIAEGIPPGSGITLNLTVNLVQQRDHGTVQLQNVTLAPGVAGRSDWQELTKKLKLLNN